MSHTVAIPSKIKPVEMYTLWGDIKLSAIFVPCLFPDCWQWSFHRHHHLDCIFQYFHYAVDTEIKLDLFKTTIPRNIFFHLHQINIIINILPDP